MTPPSRERLLTAAMLGRTPLFVLLLGIAACGSRTVLTATTSPGMTASTGGEGGAGGAGGMGGVGGSWIIGGSGGTGVGGSGAGPITGACDGVTLGGPLVTVARPDGLVDERPVLTRSSDDGEQISVVFQRLDPTLPKPTRELVHASLRPWLAWPGGQLAPTFTTFQSPHVAPAFAAAPGFGDRFALLLQYTTTGEIFAPAVDPNSDIYGDTVAVGGSALPAPVFLAATESGSHLYADSDGHMLFGHIVHYVSGVISVVDTLLACGGDARIAGAVGIPAGWIVALGNEPTAPPVGCSAAANGPSRLDLLLLSPDTQALPLATLDVGAPISRIVVAPHPGGAYVVWRVASGGVVAPIRALRIDAATAEVTGPWDVSAPADAPLDGFAAATIGDQLAVAWGNVPPNAPPQLTVSVFHEMGWQVTEAVMAIPFQPPLGLAAAPDGGGAVLSYAQPGGTVGLARLDCLTAL